MKSRIISLLMVLMFSEFFSDSQVDAQDKIVIAHPGQDTEILCDIGSGASALWRINGSSSLLSLNDLFGGAVAGHNISGRNILVVEDIMMNDVRNGSEYQCEIPQVPPNPNIMSNLTVLYVAGVPAMVPDVTVDISTIAINGSNVTLTLNWGEPFSNFDPIVNYTVSCSGDSQCASDFSSTNSTTRSYTIINLSPNISYTFSVVATNSIGSGEAGVVTRTTPPGKVTGVTLLSEPVETSNLLDVIWILIIHEDVIGYQVRYNETVMNVNSSTSALTFPAQPLPDEVTTDIVVVTVAVITRFGVGPTSLAETSINAPPFNSTVILFGFLLIGALDMTSVYNFEVNATFNNISARITISPDNMSDPNVTSNLTNVVNTMPSPSNRSDVTYVTHNNETSDEYNVPIICDLFNNSEVDMVEVIAMAEEGININGTGRVINGTNGTNGTNIAIVTLRLSCEVRYSFLAAGRRSNGTLIGPMLDLGEPNITCRSSAPPGRTDLPDADDDDELVFILIPIIILFLIAIIAGGCATFIYIWKPEKTCILAVMWILFIASLGFGLLFLGIYLFCYRREDKNLNGVKPNEVVEMKESTDLYASPEKKEDTVVEIKQQELYSYARTGPINVIMPGGKP